MEELFLEIPELIKKSIQQQLRIPRPSQSYDGRLKPVNNPQYRYPPTPPIASGELYRNVDVYWEQQFEGDGPRLVVEMPYYWTWVDEGRRPGKMPPLAAIDKWSVTKKGLSGIRDEQGRFIPRKTLNYLRARSIGKYGFKGTDFLNKAINNFIGQVENDLGEAAAQYVADIIKDQLIVVNL